MGTSASTPTLLVKLSSEQHGADAAAPVEPEYLRYASGVDLPREDINSNVWAREVEPYSLSMLDPKAQVRGAAMRRGSVLGLGALGLWGFGVA
eukprot:6380051-Prymnesium_polylepis.1